MMASVDYLIDFVTTIPDDPPADEQLTEILDSLPLRPWMEITVTPLGEHPNDPEVQGRAAT
jgi:muconolactone delta-isomerase